MAFSVCVMGNDIELDYSMIGGALDLMALSRRNNLDQETIRRAEELKRMVAGKSENEFHGKKLLRVKFTVPKKSRSCNKANHLKRKIQKSDQPARASSSITTCRPISSAISKEGTTRALPARIQGLIGLCSMPIQKQITASDVNHGLCRLMLPKPQMKNELMKGNIQLNPNEDIEGGIPVTVYGPDGGEYAMDFIFWCAKFYVLKSNWNQFCQDYGLSNLMNNNMATLTIWMFRHSQTNGLCFAITW